jgi:hypothetical protein
VDLTQVRALYPIVGPATVVRSLTVLEFPAGIQAYIRLGQSGAQIPVIVGLQIDCIAESEGVYYDQPIAGAGFGRFAWFAGGAASLG